MQLPAGNKQMDHPERVSRSCATESKSKVWNGFTRSPSMPSSRNRAVPANTAINLRRIDEEKPVRNEAKPGRALIASTVTSAPICSLAFRCAVPCRNMQPCSTENRGKRTTFAKIASSWTFACLRHGSALQTAYAWPLMYFCRSP